MCRAGKTGKSCRPWPRQPAQLRRYFNTSFPYKQDADPAHCLHAVARSASGAIVGTGRLLLNTEPPRIGRLAVAKDWRGVGVGTALLETLCGVARSRGFPRVMLNAQANATAFYYKHGFISHGAESFEAGIPHQEMRRKLA
ncbi:MAG: GNAT family N-acetyltransferase [Betaproteobacteria bacterium]|nr:GNAT family N-acetyltransferase [Betaproteobacteria bacterium]